MNEAETLCVTLRQSADDDVVDMLDRMVRDAPDHALKMAKARSGSSTSARQCTD
jgi:hypothetical protein